MKRLLLLIALFFSTTSLAEDTQNPLVFKRQSRLLSELSTVADNTVVDVLANPLTLTKGTWIMCGAIYFDLEAATSASTWDYGINTTSATLPNSDDIPTPGGNTAGNWRASIVKTWANGNDENGWIPCYPVFVSGSTNFYLVTRLNWSGTSAVVAGSLWAWKIN